MTPARKSYTCTVCGKQGFWTETWGYFGNIALAETSPDDMVFACSKTCLETAKENIGSGKWKLPTVRFGPAGARIMKKRVGY